MAVSEGRLVTGSHKRPFQLAKVNFSQMNQNSLRWERSRGKTLAKFSHDALVNGFEDLGMGLLCGSFWIHLAGSCKSTGSRVPRCNLLDDGP